MIKYGLPVNYLTLVYNKEIFIFLKKVFKDF